LPRCCADVLLKWPALGADSPFQEAFQRRQRVRPMFPGMSAGVEMELAQQLFLVRILLECSGQKRGRLVGSICEKEQLRVVTKTVGVFRIGFE